MTEDETPELPEIHPGEELVGALYEFAQSDLRPRLAAFFNVDPTSQLGIKLIDRNVALLLRLVADELEPPKTAK